jgi:outer membrane lipoprotein-sorting protein
LLLFSFLLFTFTFAAAITGEEILQKIDKNLTFTSARIEAKMVIYIGDQVREKRFVSYSEGSEKSFSIFTYPARDKGVKYLKLEDQMWMYLPSVEKIIKIAGHMLRQSMMGSDYSYKDALERYKLIEKYNAKIVSEEVLAITFIKGSKGVRENRSTYVVELTAKVKDVSYFKRTLWVDKRTLLPLKENLYAKSGKLLKVSETKRIERFGERFYPTQSTLKNLLRKNSMTEFIVTDIQFDISIPAGTFTERNLKR